MDVELQNWTGINITYHPDDPSQVISATLIYRDEREGDKAIKCIINRTGAVTIEDPAIQIYGSDRAELQDEAAAIGQTLFGSDWQGERWLWV